MCAVCLAPPRNDESTLQKRSVATDVRRVTETVRLYVVPLFRWTYDLIVPVTRCAVHTI